MVAIHQAGPSRRRPRLLRRLLAGAGLLLVVSLLGILALQVWKASVDRRLEAGWRRSLAGASFLERYPATRDNATVRDLEKLGATLGIDMAPPETPGRAHPTPEAAQRFAAIKEALKAYHTASRSSADETLAPPSPELAAFLEWARPGLDSVRARLAAGPPPVWARDLGAGLINSKIPNYLGLLMLQRLLLLEAGEQLRAGRETPAGEILEDSWRLNQAMADNNPHLVTQLMAHVVLSQQQPVLRRFSRAPAAWTPRLLGLDLQSRALLALELEVFLAHRSTVLDEKISGIESAPLSPTVVRWAIWDYARRFSAMVADLRRRDVRSLDTEALDRELQAAIPRWQIVARLMLPNFWDTWPRSAHAELEAELTALVLEERARLAAGGPPRSSPSRPSRVKGLSWIYEDLPGGTTLHLDGELRYKNPKAAPLRFTVRRVTRGSSGGA